MPQLAVTINGKTFNINCPEGEEASILSLADHVNNTIQKVAPKCKSMNESALLSFTLLSMADEVMQLKSEFR